MGQGIDNWTALHYACRKGHLRLVQALVVHLKVKDINARTKSDWTPLMLASDNGHMDVCKLLIRHHAVVDVKNREGNGASKLAMGRGHHDLGFYLAEVERKSVKKEL